mmetsp:Transcript_3354/g.7839  ORF Transcript_3354/g.7839 Transcript_3354/m.7839 type:complete len:273 (+) Transcript_3354:1199-2017(+)
MEVECRCNMTNKAVNRSSFFVWTLSLLRPSSASRIHRLCSEIFGDQFLVVLLHGVGSTSVIVALQQRLRPHEIQGEAFDMASSGIRQPVDELGVLVGKLHFAAAPEREGRHHVLAVVQRANAFVSHDDEPKRFAVLPCTLDGCNHDATGIIHAKWHGVQVGAALYIIVDQSSLLLTAVVLYELGNPTRQADAEGKAEGLRDRLGRIGPNLCRVLVDKKDATLFGVRHHLHSPLDAAHQIQGVGRHAKLRDQGLHLLGGMLAQDQFLQLGASL